MNANDLDALERAYERALKLEKSGKLDKATEAWREVLRIDPDDCGGAAVRLAAMGRGETPDRASPAYVMTLFDQHADAFDDILVRQLGYDVPNLIAGALAAHAPGPYPRMLDLGCGTGLCGVALEPVTTERVAVDLSEEMIGLAAERDLYDDLYIGEIVSFLREQTDEADWDLIVAADVLPYLGGVEELFSASSARLNAKGIFAFSTETLDAEALKGRPFVVGPNQRFAHDLAYLEKTLAGTELKLIHAEAITVRHEEGEPVPGHLVLARKN
ncbi:MAG: methyltransferase [Rhodobiaceae bacterium]|nr:methyltransferase [Rhodobiaceae bacterium]